MTRRAASVKDIVNQRPRSIVATSSLLPLEIYEVVKRVTMLRIAVLVSNVAIVAYLVWKVRASRRGLTARE